VYDASSLSYSPEKTTRLMRRTESHSASCRTGELAVILRPFFRHRPHGYGLHEVVRGNGGLPDAVGNTRGRLLARLHVSHYLLVQAL